MVIAMRLIDADVLTDAIENSRGKNSIYAQFVRAWIKEAPTIDAVPVRYGRWNCDMSGAWCSICGEYSEGEWNYCPNCGAKMDGENNE